MKKSINTVIFKTMTNVTMIKKTDLNIVLFILIVTLMLPKSLLGQWVYDWTEIRINNQIEFTLMDSTSVYAVPSISGYAIQKRVLVKKSSIENSHLKEGSILYNEKGKEIGLAIRILNFKEQVSPINRRLAKKHIAIIINGEVNSTSFIRDSWPDRALVKLLRQKRSGGFWPSFEVYLKKFNFEKYRKDGLPDEISNAGLEAYVLPFKDYLNKKNQGFRMIIFTRGTSGIQCVMMADNEISEEKLIFPKVKLFEEKPFGSIYHFGKPNKSQSEGYEVMAYDLLPFQD